MKKLLILICLLFCILKVSKAQNSKHTFTLGDTAFLLDNKPFQLISGEIHCTRVPRAYWRDRLKKAKAMGLNTIGTYVFWNALEPEEGKFDFKGNNDIAEFVKIASEEGLWVVLRPSPYGCAEWEFGGYPYWLLKDKTLKVRSKDPKFLKAYHDYIMQLGKQLSPYLISNGGNILMVQIENEYGSYSNDKEYLDINRKIFIEGGFNGLLFTCDGPSQMPAGYLSGFLPAVNGLDNPKEVKELINKYHNGKGPYYIAEWYPGWFDSWGSAHQTSNGDEDAKKLDTILSAGISINLYMFHGGTTRGFMNGANMSKNDPYSPQTSSYDYDAPLDEAGNPTAKYLKFRAVIEKHLPKGEKLPSIPSNNKTIAIDSIKLTKQFDLFSNLSQPVLAEHPLSFEDLGQAYGFVLYRTTIKNAINGELKITDLRDFATIYLNGEHVGTLDRRIKQNSILLNAPANAILDILVENNGRINYGTYLTDNRQGITENVTLNNTELVNWEMYKFPFQSVDKLKFSSIYNNKTFHASFYKGEFELTETGDTFIDMRGFGKGFVFLNGYNLGKYWYIGPQQTIYIPAGWLKKGKNEVIVFDELMGNHQKIKTLGKPVLNEVNK